MLRFRSSHFEAVRQAAASERGADAVIQPVFLDYSRIAGMPVGRRERPLVAWYGDMTFFAHFRRFLGTGGIGCDVYFGAPIRVLPESGRKTIARSTETTVRDLAGRARRAKSAILAGPGSS
jgi:1-acyl-sn-glycerol-3-phosphate acyltransferase